jgi:hypothetical protein
MQQIRKEFTKAQNLLQLVLERELLREVRNFDIYERMQIKLMIIPV